ncbi:Flagellar motility protein MotE, a chaperone for MotC folding [Desulfatibacillum alkenivorans DSM 16219]|jgi:flagellar motility protein MotE (MotC chaperone)|uniref:Flagellar motility protein MotE, a chaperone for MotC folding n=1 Tax=Desulfatibacillum alkenivorans DSM 16219 TaxID=1121393 RepID=A0A1M6V420_9BACT|nr:hypothetical protein [Desulfatibacillum alkenivorans]SHK76144.1 Flagellar motility protein MotE, a chaperone for MotC folding [Desulfatibacillum alkenivorans DSM 16219]
MKNKRNLKGAPIFILVAAIILAKLGISLVLMAQPDLQVNLEPGMAMAQTPEEDAAADPANQEGRDSTAPAAAMGESEAAAEDSNMALTPEEMEAHKLERERKELELLRTEVEGKIAELEAIQKEIYAQLEQLEGAFNAREKHLIKILSEMPAKKSAPMIDKLEIDLVVKLFAKMKSDKVASILPYLEPVKAAEIGEKLASRQ